MQRYEINDLKTMSVDDLCEKYKVNRSTIIRQLNRNGIHVHNKHILIQSPFMNKECISIAEAASELGVDRSTIVNYLKGKRVKIFEDLDITIKEIK